NPRSVTWGFGGPNATEHEHPDGGSRRRRAGPRPGREQNKRCGAVENGHRTVGVRGASTPATNTAGNRRSCPEQRAACGPNTSGGLVRDQAGNKTNGAEPSKTATAPWGSTGARPPQLTSRATAKPHPRRAT